MNYLTTSASSVTFTNAQGVIKTIVKNYIFYRINEDTVTFLVLPDADPGGDGTCFFASRIEDLTINGSVYTAETIVEALDDIFEPVNVSDVYTKEQIDDMLDNYAELTDLDQFIDATELAAALADYQEKLTAGTGITIDANNVISATGGGGGSVTVDSTWIPNSTNPAESQLIQGALADKADKSTTYTKTETDNLLNGKVSTGTLATVAASGSYTDLINTPTIPAAQIQSSWTESDTASKAYILGKPTLAAVATSGAYSDLSGTPDLSTKQDTLVSGTNIKTVNGNSILGSGNIEISSGGTQVQSDWTEADSSSMAYIQHKPTNVSAFTNDAGYLTQHQSLADVFGDVLYDSQTKHINFYGKGDTNHTTVLAYVDATSFVVDGMVSNVEVKSVTISGTPTTCLVITFNSDAGKQDINIPISQIFDASNYYTKTQIDNMGYMSPEYYSESENASNKIAEINILENNTGARLVVGKNTQDNDGAISLYRSNSTSSTSIDISTDISLSNLGSGYNTTYVELKPGYLKMNFETSDYDIDGMRFGFDENGKMSIIADDDDAVAWASDLAGKQDTLVSGTNIKTINNESILGSGNITISAGGSGTVTGVKMNNGSAISPDANGVVDLGTVVTNVDSALNASSTNPVENRAVYAAIGDIEAALQAINGTTPSNP